MHSAIRASIRSDMRIAVFIAGVTTVISVRSVSSDRLADKSSTFLCNVGLRSRTMIRIVFFTGIGWF